MADQTYNLTQTGAEVQAIINDANGVKGAGATTSLTTDYIMLKDTSGAYHKIQKSSFTEAVRNTLASLLVNNDKGTTISQIAAIASGDFGSVTPANLASVLGVWKSNVSFNDFNNCVETGMYRVWANNIQNAPLPSGSKMYIMLVLKFGDGTTNYGILQIVTSILTDQLFYRSFNSTNSGNEWNSWKEFSFVS